MKGKLSTSIPPDISLLKELTDINGPDAKSPDFNIIIKERYIFDPQSWIDRDRYWLNKAPQGSLEWKLNRKLRLTASNFGAAIGKSWMESPHDIALDITTIPNTNKIISRNPAPVPNGSIKKHYTKSNRPKQKFDQQHGVVTESAARNWYCSTRNVTVITVGLAVPKWEPRIGASLDGDIPGTDGIIEIKCPFEMYDQLKLHMRKIKSGWTPPPFYHDHIRDSHYAQMQGSMKIFGKQWCDYIVYATCSNLSYVERIPFDQTYWDRILFPGIIDFLDNILEPIIQLRDTSP
jgi:hypothetical protein